MGLLWIGSLVLTGCNLTNRQQDISNEIHLWSTISTTAQGVTVKGTTVTITQSGSYVVDGILSDGSIVVDAEGQAVELVLSGVDITNSAGPAIVFAQSSHSTITLANGTTNNLFDSATQRENYDAALYSVASLTIQGNGSLNIDGTYQEGIATEMNMTIDGWNISVQAVDDGLNANNDGVSLITINSGTLMIEAQGDGIDSNGSLTINGGKVITTSSLTDASGGLDADGTVLINGGEVIALGARNSLPADSSQQQTLAVSFTGTITAWSTIALKSGTTTLLRYTLPRDTQQIIYSSSVPQEGVSYDVYITDATGTETLFTTTTTADIQRQSGMTWWPRWGGMLSPEWFSWSMGGWGSGERPPSPEWMSGDMRGGPRGWPQGSGTLMPPVQQ